MAERSSTVGVAIVGCGTVGGATALGLVRDAAAIGARAGCNIELRHLVDVDFSTARRLGLDKRLYRKNLATALADKRVHIVVELIGGTTIARQVIEKAIAARKHVVTANKALLAHHGAELCAKARSRGVCVAFEASCGGGVPIIRALYDGLIANRVDAIYGIVNGTCNYILSAMTSLDKSYSAALKEAQALGLAEADPTLDVAGIDSAHKLAVMATLAFGQRVQFESIPARGIDKLELCDVRYGQELGYTVKLLAIGERRPEGISLRVSPAFISRKHPLAWVAGPFNAISVYGHATGHTMYYGRGAGGSPTSSAVIADVVALATGTMQRAFDALNVWPDRTPPAVQLPLDAVVSRYYLRMTVQDRPGVLARMAAVLAEHHISISSVLQHEPPPKAKGVPVVITTSRAVEGEVRAALSQIDALDVVQAPTVRIPIVDEHPERI